MNRLQEARRRILEMTGRDLWGGIDWDFISMAQHFNAVQDLGTRFSGVDGDMVHFDTQSESTPGHEWHQWIRMTELPDVIEDPDMTIQDKVRLALQGDLQVHCNCFTGDVKVRLLDGRELSFEEIWEEFGSKKSLRVCSSDENGNFVPKKATCIKTRKVKKLIRVTLDNDESFTCTPDHKIRMRDGSYRRADGLNLKDSLLSLFKVGVIDNHKVVSVEQLSVSKPVQVYCLNVAGTHNFALVAGVYVHNCPAFKYWGYQYITTQLGAAVTPEHRPPNVRNPQRKGDVCKHLALVLRVLPFWWNNIAGELAKQGYDRFTQPKVQQQGEQERAQADQIQQDDDQQKDFNQQTRQAFLRDLWGRTGRRERGEESLKRGRRCKTFEELVEEQLNSV